MNLTMHTERLTKQIGRFAAASLESRQVAKRLAALLPSRFGELKREYARRGRDHGGAKAERAAFTDRRYLEFVDELAMVAGEAVEARVQYETHTMLFQARQSLRRQRL